MTAIARIFILALAVVGIISLGVTASNALRKHYTVTCVDNDADNYGFTVPQIKAGLAPAHRVYGEYL